MGNLSRVGCWCLSCFPEKLEPKDSFSMETTWDDSTGYENKAEWKNFYRHPV